MKKTKQQIRFEAAVAWVIKVYGDAFRELAKY